MVARAVGHVGEEPAVVALRRRRPLPLVAVALPEAHHAVGEGADDAEDQVRVGAPGHHRKGERGAVAAGDGAAAVRAGGAVEGGGADGPVAERREAAVALGAGGGAGAGSQCCAGRVVDAERSLNCRGGKNGGLGTHLAVSSEATVIFVARLRRYWRLVVRGPRPARAAVSRMSASLECSEAPSEDSELRLGEGITVERG